jgi:hypothetical protein
MVTAWLKRQPCSVNAAVDVISNGKYDDPWI